LENGTSVFEGTAEESVDFYLSSSEGKNYIKLGDRNDRYGGDVFRFNEIEILSNNNVNLLELLSGEDYKFRIQYKSKMKLRKVGFRLRFIDKDEKIRFLCNNYFQNDFFEIQETTIGYFELSIPRFPLPIGLYKIQLSCFTEDGILDDLENAIEFSVIGGDFFKSGREQVSKEGVLIDYKYSLL
jgi:lipopolysaccharide transport system ATP-binding protein